MALKNILDWIVTTNLRITPKVVLPATDNEDGRLEMKGGILYVYDATRVKFVSVNKNTLIFSKPGLTNNQYLNLAGGVVNSGTGYKMPSNATIVSISVQSSTADTYSVNIRRLGTTTDLVTLSVPGVQGASSIVTNIDLNVNDDIQCYLDYTGVGVGVEDPVVMIEIAWRE